MSLSKSASYAPFSVFFSISNLCSPFFACLNVRLFSASRLSLNLSVSFLSGDKLPDKSACGSAGSFSAFRHRQSAGRSSSESSVAAIIGSITSQTIRRKIRQNYGCRISAAVRFRLFLFFYIPHTFLQNARRHRERNRKKDEEIPHTWSLY